MSIGLRIREERERLGLTQTQFAAAIGASKKSQIRYEDGSSSPDIDALIAWAEIGLDPMYVLSGVRQGEMSSGALPADELVLLDAYRGLSPKAKKSVLASLLSGGVLESANSGVTIKGNRNRTAGRDYHEKE